MKRRIMLVGAVALLALVPLSLAGAGKREADNPKPEPGAAKPFLEVGKTYRFSFPDRGLTGRVVEAPRENWVRVEILDGTPDRSAAWFNLGTVQWVYIIP